MEKIEMSLMTRPEKRSLYNSSLSELLVDAEWLYDLAKEANDSTDQAEKLFKRIKSNVSAVDAMKNGEETIYVIQRIDFEPPQLVTYTPHSFVETEEVASKLCVQLEKQFEKISETYEVNGEADKYPRFTYDVVKRNLLDK